MSIKNSILVRVRLAFMIVAAIAAAILIKVIDIQFINGEKWKKKAVENGLRYREVKATRGNIYSDNGSLLATSIPFYRLAIDPVIASDTLFNTTIDTVGQLLAGFFKDKSAQQYIDEIKEARAQRKRYKILTKEFVDYQNKKIVEQWPLFKEGRNTSGIIYEKIDRRFNPFDNLARRTLGFIQEDSLGRVTGRGLEFSFNELLAGQDGQALYQRIAGGYWKPVNDGSMIRPENGIDLETTIDIDIQQYATETLQDALRKHDANYGAVILMEVQTGEIKALVNLGKNDGEYTEDNNYAVGNQGLTEPGSTFKLVSLMALLEDGQAKIEDSVNTGDGQYEFYEECVMTDALQGGYGRISLEQAFVKSSNIGISKMVFKHFRQKPEKYLQYIEDFGLNLPLGFQMLGEAKPYIKTPKDKSWSGCTLPWMSIGYELKVSPLHTISMYNAIANGGKMVQPIVVKKVLKGKKIIREYETQVVKSQICSEKTLTTVKRLLEGVVESGTAKYIKSAEYKIAGKTGTTQKLKFGKYSQSYYTSFVGYFPADNPRYTMVVVVDEPKADGQSGGAVAAPIFRQIADKMYAKGIIKDLEKLPDLPKTAPQVKGGFSEDIITVCNELDIDNLLKMNSTPWVHSRHTQDTIRLVDATIIKGLVPNVVGMSLRDGLYLLESQGLRVVFYGRGRIKSQSVMPGAKATRGRTVVLTLG